MRHLQTKPNSSSRSKSNVGSSGGTKESNSSQKVGGGTKRISQGDHPAVRCTKKRKLSENPSRVRCSTGQKHPRESDADKTRKRDNPPVGERKSRANAKKRLEKPGGKSKKTNGKSQQRKGQSPEKVVKRWKGSEKMEEKNEEGPPTLCETFSRITTMVAETVINEKENQRSTEGLLVKVKRELDSSISTKADSSKSKTPTKKMETGKKSKAKSKVPASGKKSQSKKSQEKATLDHTESLVKVLKDEEITLAFGKGIGTRRKSIVGCSEGEQKPETSDGNKVKSETAVVRCDSAKKKTAKVMTKKSVKKEKPKSKSGENQAKKSTEDASKSSEKGKEDQPGSMKESPQKKVILRKETVKIRGRVKKKVGKGNQGTKKKVALKEAKSPKSKLGSETDGSNSDELTLSIIQRKTKKTKMEGEKLEAGDKTVKRHLSSDEIKVEEKVSDGEKAMPKCKKLKTKKEEVPVCKKSSKEKKKARETESDTDEDAELKRILTKKLRRNVKTVAESKGKKNDGGKCSRDPEQRARRLKLFGFWSGPKKHRVASLNAIAKVHCLYENESKGVLAEIEKMAQVARPEEKKTDKKDGKGEKKSSGTGKKTGKDSEKLDVFVVNKRILRGTPGTRGAGKNWDMFTGDSTTSTSSASSDESHSDTDKPKEKKLPLQPSYRQKMLKKDGEKEEGGKPPKRRRNNEIEVTMDLKDMVVRKRMASLNASAILAASYSTEKRSNRKDSSSGTSTDDGTSSVEDNDRFIIEEGRENASSKTESKKSGEPEKPPEEKSKEVTEMMNPPECTEYRHKKHFWKTKVESLKKSSKEKRNSPSPILADFGVEKDLSTTVLEKEKNDEINVDKMATKLGIPGKKLSELKAKCKTFEGKSKNWTELAKDREEKRKHSKRKLCEDEVKNINVEKVRGPEKTDEYEYKSDSDNGQRKLIELRNAGGSNKKVAVIVNQDTDVTITGVYVNSTRSTHHERFCSIAGMQYRISSTSHTQTEATAVLKTSTASEQTPSPSEPGSCTSPRGMKSYTPLSALSNMQPPASGAPSHTHLPPPAHHHHHLCGLGQHRPPPDHYVGTHGPISRRRSPISSPLGRRRGCTSAFSAPHCSSHPAPGEPSSPSSDGDGFGSPLPSHGYFQPAGPLIHHTSSHSAPFKSHNLSGLDSTAANESQPPQTSGGEESLESTVRSGENCSSAAAAAPPAPPPPPPPPTHHMGYPRGYPPYQSGYYQGNYYPPPPQSAHFQPPPASFHQHYHHHQDFCYPPGYPPSYPPPPPPPPGSYRRFLQPPHNYYSPELTYPSSGSSSSQDHGSQQMVVPGGASSSYSAPLDPYPPPSAPYYPGYSPGAGGPTCYSHPPSSRNIAFIEQTYQSCPCPMQLCPKNVHIGPLTGECKRPGALPLPPVALQLSQEPPGAAGPPSPARGSAGMPPQPSPASNSAPPHWDGKTLKSTPETKWEESGAGFDNYKSNCIVDSKEMGNFAGDETGSHAGKESSGSQCGEKNQSRRLLVFGSEEMLLLMARTENSIQPDSTEDVESGKRIKMETSTPSGADRVETTKTIPGTDSRRRKLSGEDDSSSEESPKRQKLIAKLEEILAENLDESKKKRKRKIRNASGRSVMKLKKVQRSGGEATTDRKDAFVDAKPFRKTDEEKSNGKTKLLKDRNETVESKGKSFREGIKGGSQVEGKETGRGGEDTAERITCRRKSNQERSGFFPEAKIDSARKSRSCSPGKSKTVETSSWRGEPNGKREESFKSGKSKPESRVTRKPFRSISREQRRTAKEENGQMCVAGKKSLREKGKKSKSGEGGRGNGNVSLKKFNSKRLQYPLGTTIRPKWSNGWSWDGDSFDAKVYLTNDEPPVMRKCYGAMRHVEGDVIQPKDCILLKAGPRRIDLPFVAKVAALWENPDDGEMMVSLLWYYRPEHTDQGRQPSDEQDEIFASRHKDINSVACIEDKCFVLTYNEYCRYRKKARRVEEGVADKNLLVPRLEQPYFRFQRQPPCVVAPDVVFFCRRVYDFRQRRLLKNPT